ncbi:MAG TPA: mechanosensitive ion channel family protein [Phycisphaerae bacterium]|nr:mechanosensitive ion channel family protein [Phycisphaerae bacterium]
MILLAQTSMTANTTRTASSAPPSGPGSATGAASTTTTTKTNQWEVSGTNGYHIGQGWVKIYSLQTGLSGASTLAGMLMATWVITRIFRRVLDRYRLMRVVRNGAAALTVYTTLFALHPYLMVDPKDLVAVIIHRVFVAVMLLVAIRLVDRLVIIPLLTRGGKVTLSKFIHQIILVIFSVFVAAGYCSWAFGLDISSFLAGSAVISIVLGLALQETLGNFFSGMVLQASLPFQAGDWIQIGDVEGRVVEMTWRAVTVQTNEDNYVLIPNGTVAKEQIVNYHAPSTSTARSVVIGLEYDLPPNDARRVLLEAVRETEGVLDKPEPVVLLDDYADSAINYKVKFWINVPQKHRTIENAVRVNAWYRLKRAGYGIPFPMRTVEFVDLDKKSARQREEAEKHRLTAISRNPLFASLNEEQRAKLARDADEITLGAGQVVYRQGETGDSMFLLLDGSVDVFLQLQDGRHLDVGDIDAGSFFGELSVMTGAPRPRTIRAKSDIRALEITGRHLQELFASDPTLMERISAVIARRETEQAEQARKLGERPAAASQSATQHSVLDRMRRMFTLRGRP